MADKEPEKGKETPKRRELLRRMIEIMQPYRGSKEPVSEGDFAEVMMRVMGIIGSYADDFHGAKKGLDELEERKAEGDRKERRAKNSGQFLKELNDSKDKEAISKAYSFLWDNFKKKYSDEKEAKDKFENLMDDLVDECNKAKKSVPEAICDAAKTAGYSVKESREKAVEAVKGTPSESEPEEKAVDSDKRMSREEFDKLSHEKKEKEGKEPEKEPEKGKKEEKKEPAEEEKEPGANPDAEKTLKAAADKHTGGEGERRGEMSAEARRKLKKENPEKYKRMLGFK